MKGWPLVVAIVLVTPTAGLTMESYQTCIKCHDEPGEGGSQFAPDLSETKYSLEQFTKQVMNGSKWAGKPVRKWKYRKREMPGVVGLDEKEVRLLYDYILSKKPD